MSYIFKYIAIPILITAATTFGIQNYVPLDWIDFLQQPKLGTTITTIAGTDTISGSRTTINTNFTNLYNGKIENSTTTLPLITTLSGLTSATSLASVGTLTVGIWNATAIGVAKGGTGTTSPSLYNVMLGNGSLGLTTASSTGSLGQFLTSNGAGAYPSWQTSAVNQTIPYSWTAQHTFTSLFGTIASTTNATTTNLTVTGTAIFSGGIPLMASSTTFSTAGSFTWVNIKSVTRVEVEVLGGGGGGGGAGGTTGPNASGGGGGGGYASAMVNVSGNATVVVGAAGVGGVGANNGTSGGDSSFAGIITVTGKGGTIANSADGGQTLGGGAGGSSTNANFTVVGENGQDAVDATYPTSRGGNSFFGYEGAGSIAGANAGGVATGYGGGGGGAHSTTGNARNGGAGTAGIVIVKFLIPAQ